jgi:hypothetical protein
MDKIDLKIEKLKKQLLSAQREKRENENQKLQQIGQLFCDYYRKNRFDITDQILREKVEGIMNQA